MKPLHVMVDEVELRRLERFSRQRGWTKSRTIRLAIRAMTNDGGIMASSGIIDGLPRDLSARMDDYLAEASAAKPKSRRAKRLRR